MRVFWGVIGSLLLPVQCSVLEYEAGEIVAMDLAEFTKRHGVVDPKHDESAAGHDPFLLPFPHVKTGHDVKSVRCPPCFANVSSWRQHPLARCFCC